MPQLIVQNCKLSLTLTLLRHNLLHIVLQVNQSKTQSLNKSFSLESMQKQPRSQGLLRFQSGVDPGNEVDAKRRPPVVRGAMHSAKK